MKDETIKILDHGYLRLVESWGSDEGIVEAARMSTDKGFLGWGPRFKCKRCGVHFAEDQIEPEHVSGYKCIDDTEHHDWERGVPGDEKLLRFLYDHKHATPFEMAGLIIEVKAPIMVFREWHRHRTQSYNEMSARYIPLPDEHYVATTERMLLNSKTNRQAGTVKDADELTEPVAGDLRYEEITFNEAAERFYQKKLKAGVPKELARTHLGVSRYSRMRASANLRNWLAFLTLRMDPAAQWEIRQYANALGSLVEQLFPRTYGLFSGTV